jgi:hypothetical protein
LVRCRAEILPRNIHHLTQRFTKIYVNNQVNSVYAVE